MSLPLLTIQASAQPAKKSLSQQLDEEEEKARRENVYQGASLSAGQALERARQRAQADPNDCPSGSVSRKPEDVRHYITSQERLQGKVAASIERFTSRAIPKSQAINEFNTLISENNELVKWGWGKVTNGACGPVAITKLIGESSATTSNLFKELREAIESNR
jgi:hypothetical protein